MAGLRDSHEFQLISSIGTEWCGFWKFYRFNIVVLDVFYFYRDYVKIRITIWAS